MMTIAAIYRVEINPKNNRKRWIIVRNDSDPESVGEATYSGMPCDPEEVDQGTLFRTYLDIPKNNTCE